MKLGKINILLACVVTMIATTACSKSEIDYGETSGHEIQFQSNGIDTRGVTKGATEDFAVGSVLGVLAYNLPDGQYDRKINMPDLLYDAQLTRLSQGSYNYNPIANWPNVGKVKFFAYHPHSSLFQKETIVLSPYNTSGDPKITIDFSKTNSKIDFSVAQLPPISAYRSEDPADVPQRSDYFVNFSFKRKVADLAFLVKATGLPDAINIYVNAVSIVGISTKGTYNFETDNWTDLSRSDLSNSNETQSITVSFGSIGIPLKSDYINILDPGSAEANPNRKATVVMIPTKYDVVKINAIYTIEYLNAAGGCEYRVVGTKDVPLTVDWKAGTTYTYKLEFSASEAYGNSSDFSFTVADWTSSEIDTSID